MLNSANLSFALCPLLTDGCIEALLTAGSDELKATYLHKLVSGEWTGTMNLTEPQAGSDLALVRTRAEPQPDGTYKVFGTKIYITYGEHDMADNIVHMVLARVSGAPEGVKGISLFVVPKFLVGQGRLARRAQRRALREHRAQDGHQGLADRGAAVRRPRRCRRLPRGPGEPRPRVHVHHDERGPLRGRRAGHRGGRARVPEGGGVREGPRAVAPGRRLDERQRAHHPPPRRQAHADDDACLHRRLPRDGQPWPHRPTTPRTTTPIPEVRKQNQAFYEFMVPLVKGYSTEMSLEVTSLGVQVHGGMGFIEETGAAQYYRDAKILTIYEGTTAIQANDLVGRKTARDGGQTARAIAAQVEKTEAELARRDSVAARAVLKRWPPRARPSWTWSTSSPARPRPARTRCSPAPCPT
jgi:hypothetical protein